MKARVVRADGVGHVDVCRLAAGELVHFAPVAFDPVNTAQAIFIADGYHGDIAGVLALGNGADVNDSLLAGGTVEGGVEPLKGEWKVSDE